MTLKAESFLSISPISYVSPLGKSNTIEPSVIAEVVVKSNLYLYALRDLFEQINFEIFETLGQRNLSGFVGEVFSNLLVKTITEYQINPHADGRPDLLDLSSQAAQKYYTENCFQEIGNTRTPIRGCLAPFKYGGLEVKSTIGTPVSKYKAELFRKTGHYNFEVGMSRLEYLSSINYWAHHTSCDNLLGLYYDYSEGLGGPPR